MPIPGIDYLSPVRGFRNFFGRYGTVRGSMRGVFNAVLPVAVVDRYRDDSEGSLFGMTMFCTAPQPTYPAFAVGSVTDDWELLAANFSVYLPAMNTRFFTFNVYTPDSTYIPVETPNPAGLWLPGLNTDWSFTLGSLTGVGGYNSTFPVRAGFDCEGFGTQPASTFHNFWYQTDTTYFNPPLRVYRDYTLGFIATIPAYGTVNFLCSILYRIRPRTTDGPRTGTP